MGSTLEVISYWWPIWIIIHCLSFLQNNQGTWTLATMLSWTFRRVVLGRRIGIIPSIVICRCRLFSKGSKGPIDFFLFQSYANIKIIINLYLHIYWINLICLLCFIKPNIPLLELKEIWKVFDLFAFVILNYCSILVISQESFKYVNLLNINDSKSIKMQNSQRH